MSEKSDQGTPAESITKKDGLFSTSAPLGQQQFPEQTAAAITRASSSRKNIWVRIVLPTGLLLVAIFALTYAGQQLVRWRGTEPADDPKANKPVIKVGPPLAIWKREPLPKVKKGETPRMYELEMEPGQHGYFDYVFANDSEEPAEIGLKATGCDCSKVRICVLPKTKAVKHVEDQVNRGKWTQVPKEDPSYGWEDLNKSTTNGKTIPPGQGGLLRLMWQARADKKPGDKLNLSLSLWVQPQGKAIRRQIVKTIAAVELHSPVRFFPEVLDMGQLVEGQKTTREFLVWSATRDDITVKKDTKNLHPCIQYKIDRLTEAECQKEAAALREGQEINSNIRSAYKVIVTIHENKDGHKLDIGPNYQRAPLLFADSDKAISVPTPLVKALVHSNIRVGVARRYALNLGSFSKAVGTTKNLTLYGPKDVQLKYLSHTPSSLEITLQKPKLEGNELVWPVKITAPPRIIRGELPARSNLVLEATQPDGSKRRVRLPILGTAVSSGF